MGAGMRLSRTTFQCVELVQARQLCRRKVATAAEELFQDLVAIHPGSNLARNCWASDIRRLVICMCWSDSICAEA
jgi:hypothetical protein